MIRCIGFTFLVLLAHCQVWCQTRTELEAYSDSLYHDILYRGDSERQAIGLLELSFFWSDYDTARAMDYHREATLRLGSAAETNYYRGVLDYYRGGVFFDTDPAQAQSLYQHAARILQDVPEERIIDATRYSARAWGSYGALLQRAGKPEAYVEVILDRVIPMATSIQDSTLLGNNYQNIAMALMNLQQYDKAEEYYVRAWAILQGKPGAEEQRLTLAVNAARNAQSDKKFDLSRIYLDSATRLIDKLPASSYLPMYHSVEANYWAQQGKVSEAKKHFDIAMTQAKNQSKGDMIASILFDEIAVLEETGDYATAKAKLMEVLPYVRERHSLRNKQLVYYNLASTTAKLRQFEESVGWYQQYKSVSDSLWNDRARTETLELEQRYQTAEKENELLRVKAQNQQQELSLQRSRLIMSVLVFVLAMLAFFGYLYYLSVRTRRHLAKQKELTLNEALKNQRQQEKLNLYNAMLQGEERERSRMARDLHDGLGGMLAGVKMKLSAINSERSRGTESDVLRPVIDQLDQSVHELRRVARNMMPESLLYMGLEAAMRDLCASMEHADLSIEFSASGLRDDYSETFLIGVFRITQELLSNAVKHSRADQVWVQCMDRDGQFFVTVEDNGCGFDVAEVRQRAGGIGMTSIQNRVEMLGGQFEIDSSLGKGASFHIQLQTNG